MRGQINDPLMDSKLALEAFSNQLKALQEAPAELLTAWHWLTATEAGSGFDLVFSTIRGAPKPSLEEGREAIRRRLDGQGCQVQALSLVGNAQEQGWPLAYVLAWLSVAGTNWSTMLDYDHR